MGTAHTRAYAAVPAIYPELGVAPKLIMAADTAPARVDFATSTLGYAAGTTDYREVLADPRVEVVSICAPNFLHAEIGIAAAEAGKHYWIEKPAGRNLADTTALAAATDPGRRDQHGGLQLPARAGRGAPTELDRGGPAGPDHQPPGPILRRVLRRSARRAVVAVPAQAGRQRRPR